MADVDRIVLMHDIDGFVDRAVRILQSITRSDGDVSARACRRPHHDTLDLLTIRPFRLIDTSPKATHLEVILAHLRSPPIASGRWHPLTLNQRGALYRHYDRSLTPSSGPRLVGQNI
jgi:hypothetical protein